MNPDVMSFTSIQISNDLLNEIWKFDPRTLDTLKGAKLSSYAMALAQYLIYFTYQRNLSKAEVHRLNTFIERTISLALSADSSLLKMHKTKKAATEYLVSTDMKLMESQGQLEALKTELTQTEGMDRVISELIATIKRELTRRENELYQVRRERR
jgi:hypothetical protein